MITLNHINKTYRVKGASDVKALDDVSLTFGERGLIFILGKSGSGKSTLLNCIGGLDHIDSGEIIIKDKSSKDFTQSEFDSYRNTYLGFIFQEYNILPDFTVAENISLAYELQGKKAKDEDVDKILDEVDLHGLGGRKPNELSGGQKQRVAIARALIKNPEIILADEPTGALDSTTGRAVFDTLKKLSLSRLVIVVSHDREFAEFYGDRVIELKDGKVVGDITKRKSEENMPGLRFLGDKGIVIEKGYALTDKDLSIINERLKDRSGSTLLSFDEEANSSLLGKGSLGSEKGSAAFTPTEEKDTKDSKTGEPFHLIKSRLPFKNSAKMAWKSLKVKPVKLVFTIILSSIALTLLGLSDTLVAYDKKTALVNSIADASIQAASISKVGTDLKDGYEHNYLIGENDIRIINEKFSNNFDLVFPFDSITTILTDGASGGSSGDYSSYFISNPTGEEPYWALRGDSNFSGYIPMDEKKAADYGFKLLSGNYPTSSREVLISKMVYDRFRYFGFSNDSVSISAEYLKNDDTGASFIAKSPRIKTAEHVGDTYYITIVGVLDTGFDSSPYSSLNNTTSDIRSYLLYQQLDTELKYGFSNLFYISDSYYDYLCHNPPLISTYSCGIANGSLSFLDDSGKASSSGEVTRIVDASRSTDFVYLDGASSLKKGQIGIHLYNLRSLIKKSDEFSSKLKGIALTGELSTDYSGIATSAVGVEFGPTSANPVSLYTALDSPCKQGVGKYIASVGLPVTGSIERITLEASCTSYYAEYKRDVDSTLLSWNDSSYSTEKQELLLKNFYAFYLYSEKIMKPSFKTSSAKKSIKGYFTPADVFADGGYYTNAYGEKSGKALSTSYASGAVAGFLPSSLIKIKISGDGALSSSGLVSNASIGAIEMGMYAYSLNENDTIFLGTEDYAHFLESYSGSDYDFAISKMPSSRDEIRSLVNFSYEGQDGGTTRYKLLNKASTSLDGVDPTILVMKNVFLYVGLAFALFAALLLGTFIGNSVSAKKREIGILRAVGARSSDVYGIFLNESIIIALFNGVVASILTLIGAVTINAVFKSTFYLPLSILSFSIRQIAIILGVAIVTAIVASFIPSYKISRKKPIDSINDK